MCKAFSMKNCARICYKQNEWQTIKNCVSKAARKWNCYKRNGRNEERKKWTRTTFYMRKLCPLGAKLFTSIPVWVERQWRCGCVAKWIWAKWKLFSFFVYLSHCSLCHVSLQSKSKERNQKNENTWPINNNKPWIIFVQKNTENSYKIFPSRIFEYCNKMMMFVSFEESFLLLELFRSRFFLWFFYIFLDPFPTDWAYIFKWNFMYDFFYWSLPEIRQCIINICWSEKYENQLVLCNRKPLFLCIFLAMTDWTSTM